MTGSSATAAASGADRAPMVVAVGGGAGLSTSLRAVRRYASDVVAVVAMADDGGSTGRLRRAGLDIVPGDLRKCLVALAAPESMLAAALDHRFDSIPEGPEAALNGHSVGNLLLAALAETSGDLLVALDHLGGLLEVRGRVLPAATGPLTLLAETGAGPVRGQVAITASTGIERVAVEPAECGPPSQVIEAILAADQVVLGPGSLFTSVLAALVVPGISDAIHRTGAQVVYVANLRPQVAETMGMSLDDHLDALRRHGIETDVVLVDRGAELGGSRDPLAVLEYLARPGTSTHDPALLSDALWRCYQRSR